MSYDSNNCVTPVTWYETLIMFPRETIFAIWPYAACVVLIVFVTLTMIWRYYYHTTAKVENVEA